MGGFALSKNSMSFNKWIVSIILIITIIGSNVVLANEKITEKDILTGESLTQEETVIAAVNKKCSIGMVIETEIKVEEAGEYELVLQYTAISRNNPIISFKFNGEFPIAEAERIEFLNNWIDGESVRKDDKGNEIAAEQVLSSEMVSSVAMNRTGMYEFPYTFNLKKGINSIVAEVFQGEFFLSNIAFKKPEETITYKNWLSQQKVDGSINKTICIEAEKTLIKNDRALIPLSDNASVDISPANPTIRKLNYIGGSNWSTVGDTITWSFNCEKAGYYHLGFQYKQDTVINGVSYRHLKIDGKTPFSEARRVKFKYGASWKFFEYSDGDKPYLFYLDKGEHTISLAVTAGELADVYLKLSDVVAKLGDLYIDITMIVGETVDNNRSYELFNQIPQFNDRLDEYILDLKDLVEVIEKLQGENNGSLVSNIISAIEILEQMRDNPYSAHRYKSSYYTSFTNLSATLGTLTNMPLDLDRIFVIGNTANIPKSNASFAENIGFSLKRFLITFSEDYGTSDIEAEESVTLWVNWGRDQAQVLSALIREDFTSKTGIDVNLKITNASIIQGILAGKGPDVMLHMSRAEPINLAMRGALVDISEFDDYKEVIKNFADDATTPYIYRGKTYALPDTQNFYMMFVRTDIFDEFGLKIPKTWDEFLSVATTLQRNNLQAYLPYTQISSSTTVNVGVGGLTLYPTFLMQNGLSLYNKNLSASTLTDSAQLKVFTEWCELYTKYKIPRVMDFYNRFRIGSAPIGISPYTLITQIKATCPEIEGDWTVSTIPGTVKTDGSIDYTSSGSGSGCAITKLSKNPDNAWEFLKWWTSADTQIKYSNNLESYIGPLGRVATANVEAITDMGWNAEILPAIIDQLENTREIEEIPGGYYTARGIDQAFWNVVEQNKKPKDMLIEWGEIVNREIERKRKEYNN